MKKNIIKYYKFFIISYHGLKNFKIINTLKLYFNDNIYTLT